MADEEVYPTLRELVYETLTTDTQLATLMAQELPAVYDADSADSPKERPFIVVRWMEAQPGMGAAKIRPFDLWAYDSRGDRRRPTLVASRAADALVAVAPVQIEGGWLFQFEKGEQGQDLAEDQYDALVIPWHMRVVASGL